MPGGVCSLTLKNHQIVRVIVISVFIDVMYNFALFQWPSQHKFGYYAVRMPAVYFRIEFVFSVLQARLTQFSRTVSVILMGFSLRLIRVMFADIPA